MSAMEKLEMELRIELMAGCGLMRSAAMHRAARVIAIYEKHAPSGRLREILAERRVAVHDLVRPATLERHEPRACEVCNKPIEPGEAYTPNGPAHARHKP